MKKRILSLALTLALAMSLAVPALAAEKFDKMSLTYSTVQIERDGEGHMLDRKLDTGSVNFSNAYQVQADVPFYSAEYKENLYYDYDQQKWCAGSGTYTSRKWVTVIGPGCEITVDDPLWGPEGILYANNSGEAEIERECFLSYTGTADGFIQDEDPFISENATSQELIRLLTAEESEGRLFTLGLYDGVATGSYYIYVAGDSAIPAYLEREKPSAWAAEDVDTAIAAGLLPMYLRDDYTKPITREDFCALAVALYETYTGSEIQERMTFDDTIALCVEKMAGLGVVNGVGDNRFDPDGTLDREQAATILARLSDKMGYPLKKTPATFADSASVSSWAADAVGQMQASGIMGGVGNNTFSPKAPYTREQSVITILRLFNEVRKKA